MDDLKKQFYLYRQQPGDDNSTHLSRFKDMVEVLDSFGSSMLTDLALIEEEEKEKKKKGMRKDDCTKISRD